MVYKREDTLYHDPGLTGQVMGSTHIIYGQ